MQNDFDTQVRLTLYRMFVDDTRAPYAEDIAEELKASLEDVRAAIERLAAGKAIVLQPESRDVLMANPLCTVPTPYYVTTAKGSYFASCIWDSFGISAMFGKPGIVNTSCACCGEEMAVGLAPGHSPVCPGGIIHFAVPAKKWWENIVFT